MKPIKESDKQVKYTHPDTNIEDLWVYQVKYSDGILGYYSVWKPSFKEIIKLLFGKPLYVGLLNYQPPIAVLLDKKEIGIDI